MSERPVPSGRVVVTGVGAVTPLGTGVDVFWPQLLAGVSGAARITHLDPSEYTTQIGCEVKDFNPEDWLDKKEARRMDPFLAFAAAAATQAMRDSGIQVTPELADEFGVMIGSGIGGLEFLGTQHRRQIEGGPGKISPFLVPYMIPDMASGLVSIMHGLRGPNSCVVTACATGAHAIGDAYHIIKRGDAAAMLAGGSEAPICELALGGFCAARTMSTRNDDPARASRPFDKDRDGFVMGEGAAVLLLEDYDHAVQRGAKIYGEIVGYGMTGDAYHITQPSPEHDGAFRAMRMALRTAGIQPGDIDYINAHGTSTHYNDKLETMALKKLFGEVADKVAISSTKSMTGHMLGAAGALEVLICLLSMKDGMVPPTINYETPDPECDIDCVPNVARKKDVSYALSNSFGFGGHNATIVVKKLA